MEQWIPYKATAVPRTSQATWVTKATGEAAVRDSSNGRFDEAMGKFALAYADQAERDHAALQAAVSGGTIEVQLDR
jgi:hypothetical protein